MESGCAAALIVTDRERGPLAGGTLNRPSAWKQRPVVVYRPRSLAVGVGCRRGVPVDELEELLVTTFRANNLSLSSIQCLATAELKKDEPGIQELADKYQVPFSTNNLGGMFGFFFTGAATVTHFSQVIEDPSWVVFHLWMAFCKPFESSVTVMGPC